MTVDELPESGSEGQRHEESDVERRWRERGQQLGRYLPVRQR